MEKNQIRFRRIKDCPDFHIFIGHPIKWYFILLDFENLWWVLLLSPSTEKSFFFSFVLVLQWIGDTSSIHIFIAHRKLRTRIRPDKMSLRLACAVDRRRRKRHHMAWRSSGWVWRVQTAAAIDAHVLAFPTAAFVCWLPFLRPLNWIERNAKP